MHLPTRRDDLRAAGPARPPRMQRCEEGSSHEEEPTTPKTSAKPRSPTRRTRLMRLQASLRGPIGGQGLASKQASPPLPSRAPSSPRLPSPPLSVDIQIATGWLTTQRRQTRRPPSPPCTRVPCTRPSRPETRPAPRSLRTRRGR